MTPIKGSDKRVNAFRLEATQSYQYHNNVSLTITQKNIHSIYRAQTYPSFKITGLSDVLCTGTDEAEIISKNYKQTKKIDNQYTTEIIYFLIY